MNRRRVLLVLLFAAVFLLIPSRGLAQQTYDVSYDNQSLEQVIKDLRKKTGYEFVYQKQLLEHAPRISCHYQKVSLLQMLDRIFYQEAAIDYDIVDKTIVLKKAEVNKGKGIYTVSGRITDGKGDPLQWATVLVEGTTYGTTTDENGNFKVNVPAGERVTVLYSFLGYKPIRKVYEINKNTTGVKIILHEDASQLDEVVVTGYQVLDKRSLTSAVSSVKAEDILRSDVSSIDQMLEGKITDLIVMNNSGEIGVAPKIRIRGTSTVIGNREPLWVVDGIIVRDPVDIAPEELNDPDYVNRIGNAISGINPQDIERIDVLKDAAATAIYGTRAANGVIVITTKRGSVGKPQVSYNVNVNYKRRPRYSDRSVDVMTSKERVQFSRELLESQYLYYINQTFVGYEGLLRQLYNHEITNDEFNESVACLESQNTDWFKALTNDSWSTQHTASISGGSQTSRYYASLGYDKQNDVVKANNSERYTASLNFDNTFSKLLTASLSFNAYSNRRHYYQDEIAPLQYAYTTSRTIPLYDNEGNYYMYNRKYGSGDLDLAKFNILNELENSNKTQNTSSFTITSNLKFTFTDWLNANFVLSYTEQSTDQEGYWGDKTYYVATLRGCNFGEPIPIESASLLPQGGELSVNNIHDRNVMGRIQLNANKYYGMNEVHNIDATVGFEASHDKYRGNASVSRGYFPDRGLSFIEGLDLTRYTAYRDWLAYNTPSITNNLTNTVSGYASFTYAYAQLFRLNINGRVDGSNKFGDRSNERFLPIWSASGSLNLKDLGLIPVNWVDYATLKASYGSQGNMLSTEYPVMTIRKGTLDTAWNEFTSSINKYPNPDLEWETTKSYNLGLDASFFKRRLMFEASVFYKKTKNAFMNKAISTVNGIGSYIINGGDITNKGYSLDITATPIQTKDFRWTMSTSISKIINTMDSRPEAQTYDLNEFLSGAALVKGKSVNTFYSYRFLGLSPADGGPMFDDFINRQQELTGLSKYDTYTMVLTPSGKRDPDIQGSLINTFRYKNWRANISLAYSLGAKTRLFAMYGASSNWAYSTNIQPERNYSRDYINRWKHPGDERYTNIPAIISSNSEYYIKYQNHFSSYSSYTNNAQAFANNPWVMYDYSDIRVVSADYLKFQSGSITYEFDSETLRKMHLQRLALTLSAYNLFTIADKKLKGQTPTQGGFSTIQLSDRPSFSFGLNINF